MRGAVLYGPHDVRFEEVADPRIVQPTDAIISVPATCICGSDLWPYRGIQPVTQPTPFGHEYSGTAPSTPPGLARRSASRTRVCGLQKVWRRSLPAMLVSPATRCFDPSWWVRVPFGHTPGCPSASEEAYAAV